MVFLCYFSQLWSNWHKQHISAHMDETSKLNLCCTFFGKVNYSVVSWPVPNWKVRLPGFLCQMYIQFLLNISHFLLPCIYDWKMHVVHLYIRVIPYALYMQLHKCNFNKPRIKDKIGIVFESNKSFTVTHAYTYESPDTSMVNPHTPMIPRDPHNINRNTPKRQPIRNLQPQQHKIVWRDMVTSSWWHVISCSLSRLICMDEFTYRSILGKVFAK